MAKRTTHGTKREVINFNQRISQPSKRAIPEGKGVCFWGMVGFVIWAALLIWYLL